jgi:hypothetical protein
MISPDMSGRVPGLTDCGKPAGSRHAAGKLEAATQLVKCSEIPGRLPSSKILHLRARSAHFRASRKELSLKQGSAKGRHPDERRQLLLTHPNAAPFVKSVWKGPTIAPMEPA